MSGIGPISPTAIEFNSATIGADVTLTAGASYYDGPTFSLGAGTWLVIGSMNIQVAGADRAYARLWDGTNVFSEGEAWMGQATGEVQLPVMAIVVLAAPTTVKMSGRVAGGGTMRRQANGTGFNNGTQMMATRLR